MAYWLFKSEPDTFGIDDLAAQPQQTDHWDGVRNYQARNMMRDEMKVGDRGFFYHSNTKEPGIVGIVEIVRAGYPDHTAFDPEDPVPTIGGNTSSYLTYEPREEPVGAHPLGDRNIIDFAGRGGYDQRTHEGTFGASPPYGPLAEREDVCVFRTPPLEQSVEIAGPIRVRVYGSTDGEYTDFTAKLIDEYPPSADVPEGFALNLCDSICRARYRGYRREPDVVNPGEVYEFYMEPYPTANVFAEGHRIRLDISSSNYPRYDVNHNTGGPLYGGRTYRVATNTVYHERAHPTHVELPVRPG
jgi:predicted acyl esterase